MLMDVYTAIKRNASASNARQLLLRVDASGQNSATDHEEEWQQSGGH
jgi:hypothetical protein